MQLWQYCLLVTAKLLYMFRTLSASIIRSTTTVVATTGACPKSVATAVATDLGHAPVAATTVVSTPDDGRRKRPKHVE